MEANLTAILKTLCPNVFPDVAPKNVTKPYMTWQQIGGQSSRLLDNSHAGMRNQQIQINAWGKNRDESLTLIRQAEDALCGSALMIARPLGDSISVYEEDTGLYGSILRFDIWASR